MKFNIFELGICSFNSYVYYLTRGFIALTRAFNLLTRAFHLPTRAFSLPTRAFNLATRAFSLLIRIFEIVTRGFELVTRNSCFTFPLERRHHDLGEKMKDINERLKRFCNSKGFLFIDNSSVDENSLNKSLLYLSRYGNRLFSRNLINTLKGISFTDMYKNDIDMTKHS